MAPAALDAARRLHRYVGARHVHDGRLEGADQGVRWNIRVWRFVKSYLPALRPHERYFFLQGQAYWALASWALGDLTGDPAYHAAARAATRVILATQRPDGAWDYPLLERKHLIATVEGNFGAVALLEGFRRDGEGAARCRDRSTQPAEQTRRRAGAQASCAGGFSAAVVRRGRRADVVLREILLARRLL